MKYLITVISSLSFLIASTAAVFAAPSNATNNPNIVANYNSGPHGIVGENDYHSGQDVVMQNGNSGNLQQWFYGPSLEGNTEGDHSVWILSKDGTCPSGWYTLPNAYPAWGTYLQPGATYCVKTNDYHVQN